MEDNKLIDGAEYITLEEAKRLRRQNKKKHQEQENSSLISYYF